MYTQKLKCYFRVVPINMIMYVRMLLTKVSGCVVMHKQQTFSLSAAAEEQKQRKLCPTHAHSNKNDSMITEYDYEQ